jgi:hypothetical protein
MILDNFNNAISIEHSKHFHDLTVSAAEIEKLSEIMLHDLHVMDDSIHRVEETSIQTLSSVTSAQQGVAKISSMEDGKAGSMYCRSGSRLTYRYSFLPNLHPQLAVCG